MSIENENKPLNNPELFKPPSENEQLIEQMRELNINIRNLNYYMAELTLVMRQK